MPHIDLVNELFAYMAKDLEQPQLNELGKLVRGWQEDPCFDLATHLMNDFDVNPKLAWAMQFAYEAEDDLKLYKASHEKLAAIKEALS
jgi:hypothetical protein